MLRCGPKRLHADIGSLKRFRINSIGLAKKVLSLSGPSRLEEVISLQKVVALLALISQDSA